MLKQKIYNFSLAAFCIAVIGVSYLIYPTQSIHPDNNAEEEAKKDGIDKAMQQEYAATKDPALGYVPRHRLVKALNKAEALRNQAAKRKKGAIPGITWTERGPDNVGGRSRAILIDQNDPSHKTVFAAGVSGGLWKTTDITASPPTWTPVNDQFDNLAITSIAQDPSHPDTIYFGTGEGWYNADAVRGDGIWRSTDGGSSWTQLSSTASSNDFHYVNKIEVNSNSKVFAATRSVFSNRGGLMMSTDAGATWSSFNGDGASPDGAADVEIASNGDIYVSFGIFYTDGVYKSTDGGSSWSFVFDGSTDATNSGASAERIEIAHAPSNSSTVYLLGQSASTNGIEGIYKTTNGGSSWSAISTPGWCDGGEFTRQQAWYDLIAGVDPNNANVIYIGGIDLFKSTDGGSSWSQISSWRAGCGLQLVHADQHAIEFYPGESDSILFGNDGGIYLTTDAGGGTPTIVSKESDYRTTQFYACAIHPTSASNYFLAGAQDNGSHQFTSPGINSTTEVTGGDGAFCHIDQNESSYQFTSYVYNRYYRSTDGGASWSGQINFGSNGKFINPTDYDNNDNKLYASYSSGSYLRWDDPQTGTTANSENITEFGGGQVSAVTVSPNTAERVFFGLDNGRVVRVDNAATSPAGTNITGGSFPGGTVSSIALQNGRDDHLLVTFSNYGVTSVWESLDGGSTWTAVEGNLPDMPVRWAMFNPHDSIQAMVATELGVWSTDSLAGTNTDWAPSNTGLANVRTDMLQYRSSDSMVIAATHGRGLFSSDVFSSSPLPLDLISFNGVHEKDQNTLTWTTAAEENIKGFKILRATNTSEFIEIGFVKAKGTLKTEQKYSFTDQNIKDQTYYYRLEIIDYNKFGVNKTSKTIAIGPDEKTSARNGIQELNLYPNPFTHQFTIELKDLTSQFPIEAKLISTHGQTVWQKRFSKKQGYLLLHPPSGQLQPGMYFLQLTPSQQPKQTVTLKVFKQAGH